MARQLRVEYPGPLYHLTARCNDQQTSFNDETGRQHLLKLLALMKSRLPISPWEGNCVSLTAAVEQAPLY